MAMKSGVRAAGGERGLVLAGILLVGLRLEETRFRGNGSSEERNSEYHSDKESGAKAVSRVDTPAKVNGLSEGHDSHGGNKVISRAVGSEPVWPSDEL